MATSSFSASPGPWVRDNQDVNQSNSALYWFLWVFFVVYVIVTFVWLAFFVHNASPTYTYFKNPGAPGAQLDSVRYNFAWMTVRLAVFAHVMVVLFLMAQIAYRNDRACNILWFILFLLAFALCILALAGMGSEYASCNGQNQYANMCNDLLWCCVNEIHTNPANMCPNTLDCPAGPVLLDQLSPNGDFLAVFWMHFALVILLIVYLSVMIGFWCYNPGQVLLEEQEMDMETEKGPPLPYNNWKKTSVSTLADQHKAGARSRLNRLKE
jgi:hypothetical protein